MPGPVPPSVDLIMADSIEIPTRPEMFTPHSFGTRTQPAGGSCWVHRMVASIRSISRVRYCRDIQLLSRGRLGRRQQFSSPNVCTFPMAACTSAGQFSVEFDSGSAAESMAPDER